MTGIVPEFLWKRAWMEKETRTLVALPYSIGRAARCSSRLELAVGAGSKPVSRQRGLQCARLSGTFPMSPAATASGGPMKDKPLLEAGTLSPPSPNTKTDLPADD